jgi:hypothetical protein
MELGKPAKIVLAAGVVVKKARVALPKSIQIG